MKIKPHLYLKKLLTDNNQSKPYGKKKFPMQLDAWKFAVQEKKEKDKKEMVYCKSKT